MRLTCDHCGAAYRFDDSKLPPQGIKSRCKQCGRLIHVRPQRPAGADQNGGSPEKTGNAGKEAGTGAAAAKEQSAATGGEEKAGPPGTPDPSSFAPSGPLSRRWVRIAAAAAILLLAGAVQIDPIRGFVFEGHLFEAMDEGAEAKIDENIERAAIAYGLARGINAVVSIIQDSQVDVGAMGTGMTIAFGEFVDPANDLIERFSWIMLLSLVSLGIMKVLIPVGSWLSVEVLLFLGLLCLPAFLVLNERKGALFFSAAKKALLAALVVRLAIPAVTVLNHAVYRSVLHDEYTVATGELEQSREGLEKLGENLGETTETEAPPGWLDKLAGAKKTLAGLADVKRHVAAVKEKLAALTDNLIRLSVVFLLSTVLIPIGFLWLLVQAVRWIFGSRVAVNIERNVRNRIFDGRNHSQGRQQGR